MAEDRRKFEDARGDGWEIHPREDYKWYFVPLEDNDAIRTIVTPPPQVDDPFELDQQELQKLLDGGIPTQGITEPLSTPS
jgi:hypothetical protein